MYGCCYGIRLNTSYQELTCEHRDHCPYYLATDFRMVVEHPDEYTMLDTYNAQPCAFAPANGIEMRRETDNDLF